MGPINVIVQDGNNLILAVTPTPETNIVIDRGVAGAAATVAIGTTTTLSPGSPATVVNVGTSAAAVLNFGIPTAGGISAGGAPTQVQYNLGGVLAGSVNMTFSGTTLNAFLLTEANIPVVVQSDVGTLANEIPLNQHLGELAYMNTESFVITPPALVTPAGIGDMAFQLTNNTTLVVKVKGSDGVVRSATLTLA